MKQIAIFFLIATIAFGSIQIENPNYARFQKIGVEQGLSQSSIFCITQDKIGYMWFGTATGLNRYDGYEFVVYLNNSNDSLSISDNEITALYEDKNGFLWIGTGKGILNKFDPHKEIFTHYDIASSSDWYSTDEDNSGNYPITFSRNENSTITSIAEDKFGNLWIGTWGKGIVRFNPETQKKKYFYHFKNRPNSLSSNKIVKLLVDSKNILWIGTFGDGLNRITFGKNEELKIESYKTESEPLFGKRITSIFEDSDSNIWIGSYAGGISVIPNTEKINVPITANYKNLTETFSTSSKNILNIMSIVEDRNNNIWIGTYGDGLYSYSKKNKETIHFISEVGNPNSIGENEIQSMYIDYSGILWIGTQLGSGINKLEINYNKFKTIPVLAEKFKSLNDNIVWAVHEDNFDNLWIGTHRGGINKLNKKTNELTYLKKDVNQIDDHIRTIIEDKKGNIWFGGYSGGLGFYDYKKSVFRKIENVNSNKSLTSKQVQALWIDGDSILWIGTFGGGLNKLNIKNYYDNNTVEFQSFIHNPADANSLSEDKVYVIYIDSKNNFWIGTHGGGLNKFDRENKIFTSFKSDENKVGQLTDNRVMCINETFDGRLLIGTFGGGLDILNLETMQFENISTTLSITCTDIYGILKDKESGYWISTDNGIYKLDKDLRNFRQYDISDGLQSLEFSGGAYLIGKDSTFYFGGINGVNYFNPHQIKIDNYVPPVVISRIKLFDNPIKGEKDKLVFGRDENYFSFEFASLDFKNSSRNKYKFILEGLDNKWTYTDASDRRVYYANLAPGKYVFKVQGTNNDGVWSPNEAKVEIMILAPFWLQWWFIAGLILLIGGLITFFINQRIRYLVALEALKSNIAADLHDNVGAGLTEISILGDLAINSFPNNDTAKKHIIQINNLSRELVQSMSDIVWVVNPNKDSLFDLVVRLKDTYGDLLTDLGIKLETSDLDKLSNIKLPMDFRQNFYLILKEAINNSIKHSKCSKIVLNFNILKNNIKVQIIDNGIGFEFNRRNMGNGLVNIQKRVDKIKGILKVSSEIGSGTEIQIEGEF